MGAYVPYGVGIPSGTLAQQPTGLGVGDAGALYMVLAPYNHLCRWDGSAWRFAPGDCGNGFFHHCAFAPQEPGWLLCNGGAGDYLVMGGATITVQAFTTPNLASTYLKGAGAYTGTPVAASVPALAGTMGAAGSHGHTGTTDVAGANNPTASTTAAGSHSHPGSTTDSQGSHGHSFTTDAGGGHNHTGETNALGDHSHSFGVHVLSGTESQGTFNADAGSSAPATRGLHAHGVDYDGNTSTTGFHSHVVNLVAVGNHTHTGGTNAAGAHAHNATLVADGSHTHPVAVSAIPGHSHVVTATAVGDHTHGNGTLAVSGSGEPLHVDVLIYFRR
jgi:hypothetical protein